jgi:hypothetical protein
MRDDYQYKTKEIFIARNGHHFGSRVPTRVRHFENRASRASYPHGQVNCPTF